MTRPKKRINIFLKLIDWNNFILYYYPELPEKIRKSTVFHIKKNIKTIKRYWKENSDLRIGQLLISIGYIPDNLRVWSKECNAFLRALGVSQKEYQLWGTYGINNNQKIKFKLLKDLDISHLNNILKTQNLSLDIETIIKNELKFKKKKVICQD